jgi:hypothetical protein
MNGKENAVRAAEGELVMDSTRGRAYCSGTGSCSEVDGEEIEDVVASSQEEGRSAG